MITYFYRIVWDMFSYNTRGRKNSTYVSVSYYLTEYSFEELYASIENTIPSYEKENRKIRPY